MKSLRSAVKWLLAVVGLLFVLFILKIVLVLTAKPKITVDYVAEYNRITRPANYDPNDNAATYYQKALDAFVSMPKELHYQQFYNQHINWPADFNTTEQTLLENWLPSNSKAFEYFKIAANKPYCWWEKDSASFLELGPLRLVSQALLCNAKLAASKDKLQTALENILVCYKAGCQLCRTPSPLIEQVVGRNLKNDTTDISLMILDKTHIDSSALKSFQDILQAEFDKDTYVLDFEVEKLMLYDILQWDFTDNGRGTGRWTFRAAFISSDGYDLKNFLNCFIGPTKNQTAAQIEKAFAIYNQISTKTPWQLRNEGYDYLREIEKIKNSNFFLQHLLIKPEIIFYPYYEAKMQTQALLTVLAILRFKNDSFRLPASLDELVSARYLQSVPMDPYNNGPLVYKPDGDNFKLYSVGENFSDDGGSNEAETKQESAIIPSTEGHLWGTTTIIVRVPVDIVYWPVKKSKVPYHQLSAEEIEKLKADKEADVLGTAQDQNSSTSAK